MLKIRELRKDDLEPLREFTDREIGAGYYTATELAQLFDQSLLKGVMHSLILVDDRGQIEGLRLTYPPGRWEHGKGHGLTPGRWPHPLSHTAYFQSLFLSARSQGQGHGGNLSREAIQILRHSGAKGVVCHSWKESPHDSSNKYLRKLGFKVIGEHPLYWRDVDYRCTRCGSPPCQCTAVEMYLDLVSEQT